MTEFYEKVAVVTGAVSGIGRALADECVRLGMSVILADIEEPALRRAEDELSERGEVMAVRTDVSKADEVDMLAKQTLERFGAVHLLFNNAGVGGSGCVWENSLAEWEWVLGVNLWGVSHGLRTFVPIMLRQDTDCHIVNTASVAGLVSPAGMGIYNVSKHGVVSLSETLYHELSAIGSRVRVSVLCPSFVKTRIADSERNRPAILGLEIVSTPTQVQTMLHEAVEAGIPAEQVAVTTFEAIRQNRFYVFTHADSMPAILLRMEDILQERAPTNIMAERK